MKNLVYFGLKGVDGREFGVIVKDENFKGGSKVVDTGGACWAISEVVIEPELKGWDHINWHLDAMSNGGASIWECIQMDIESFWWRLGIYRQIKRNYKMLYS